MLCVTMNQWKRENIICRLGRRSSDKRRVNGCVSVAESLKETFMTICSFALRFSSASDSLTASQHRPFTGIAGELFIHLQDGRPKTRRAPWRLAVKFDSIVNMSRKVISEGTADFRASGEGAAKSTVSILRHESEPGSPTSGPSTSAYPLVPVTQTEE